MILRYAGLVISPELVAFLMCVLPLVCGLSFQESVDAQR